MSVSRLIRVFVLLFALILPSACVTATNDVSKELAGPVPILGTLSGDFPVSALEMLPDGQQDQSVGYLRSQKQLDTVLQSIQVGDRTFPSVDFSSQIVLYTRNTVFYNRLSIGQVLREGETLTIVAMETMSAMPITDKVAISLVTIERDGAKFLDAGGLKVTIEN